MNEPLRRALLRARLREVDVAARLGVDPKTVRRWLNGRVPYTSNRLALADLLDADEADLWPGAGGPLTIGSRPEEMGAIYPHRWAVPRETWVRFFESAEHEIVETGEIMAFVGADFVITVRHGEHSSLRDVRSKLEADPEQLALGPASVLHAIADHVVDSYVEVTDAIEADIDVMEGEVFEPRSKVDSEQIYVMKREVLELRRAVVPLGAPVRKLTEGYSSLVPHEVRSYFRDVDDHMVTVTERIAGFNELLTTLVDAALAKITMRQNDDMRKITAWAGIISVPTMIAGIYGMNFDHMPELHWTYSYGVVWVVIVTVCTMLHRTFRRNKWL